MSITDTRLRIGFQRLIIIDNPSVSDFGDSQRGSVCRAKVEGNYADLEFAREVIEGLSKGVYVVEGGTGGTAFGSF
jgi:hypothetical protein